MKRLGLILIALLLSSPAFAVTNTPVLVQASIAPSSQGNLLVTQWFLRLANPILTGNFLACSVDNDHLGVPSSVADSAGHTLTLLESTDNGNSNHQLYYFNGAATGGQTVTITYLTAVKFIHMVCYEFAHIDTSSPLDSGGTGTGKCKAHATNSALDCSAFSTTQANDLVIYGFDQNDTLATIASFLPGAGYALGGIDNLDSLGFEYAVQAGIGAATPTVTLSASHAWQGVGGLFKYSAGAGTEPSGMRVSSYANYNQKSTDNGATVAIQFACNGTENLIALYVNGAAGRAVSAVTSTGTTGTWAKAGDAAVNGGSGLTTLWYLANATCTGSTIVTISESGGAALNTASVMFGMTGAATAPLNAGSPVNTTGTSSSNASFLGASVVAASSGISTWYIGANTGLASAVASSSAATFLGCGTVVVINTSSVCENQGASALAVGSGSTNQITWQPNSVATGIGAWSDFGAHWKAPAGGGSTGGNGKFMLLGVGGRR